MYSKAEAVSIPPVEEVVVFDGTETELELIKKKTKGQLELLKKQTERLELFDAKIDIDFAIKWYEISSSQFSKLAYFYGQKGWFDRQVLHGEVVAGAIVLGLAVHALAFFAVVGAYYKLSEILSDHYNIEEANKEAIRKSFDGLKEELKQSIETFNEMERKLDEAFTALEEQTVSLSATIAQLGIEAGKLHSQVTRLEGMVKQLQEQQQKMLATTGKLNDAGEKLSQEISSLSVIILEKKTAIDLVSGTIESVVAEAMENKKLTALSLSQAKEEKGIITRQKEKCQESLDVANKSIEGTKEVFVVFDKILAKSGAVDVEVAEKSRRAELIYERARRATSSNKKDTQGRGELVQENPETPALR